MLNLKLEKLMMDIDTVDTNTLAWRVMLAREQKDLRQIDLVALMNRPPYNPGVSTGAYSKIETSDTLTPKHDTMIALSEILGVSINWLIAGREWHDGKSVDVFISPEANRTGEMVDQMMPDERIMAEDAVRIIYKLSQNAQGKEKQIDDRDAKIKELRIEVAALLKESTELNRELNRIKQLLPQDIDSANE